MRGEALQILDYRCAEGQPVSSEEWAPGFEIDLPRTGAYLRRSSYGRDLADANSAIFFRKGQPYDIQHPLGGGDRTTVFVLDEQVLREFVGRHSRGGNRAQPDIFPVGLIRITSREQALHHALLRALAVGHSTDPLLVQEIAFTLIRELLLRAHADDHKRDPLPQTEDRQRSDLADRVKMHLIERLNESVSLESLAGHLNYSPFYLAHMFRLTTRMTIHRTLVRLRLAEAIERIADLPDRNLADLALDLGFSSHSHFTSVFSREFGFPPSAFSSKDVYGVLRAMRKILIDHPKTLA
jgi:AraC-like DNA-binding protein